MKEFTPILAEVADKEPNIASIWCIAAFFCLVAFLLCRWRKTGGLIALPLAALWAWTIYSWLQDANEGPAVLQELGRGYVLQGYAAGLLPFVFLAIGFCRSR